MNGTTSAWNYAKWNALVRAVLNLQVLLQNDKLYKTTKVIYIYIYRVSQEERT
jgi:hypothetical protein